MSNRTQQTIRLRLWHEQPRCAYCRTPLSRRSATLDHVLPLSRGGTDSDDNSLLCCSACNLSKGNRTIIEWIADLLTAAGAAGVLR